jgi:hypothetical protein
MRAKFIRGQDPKDSIGIGDIGWRGMESVLKEFKEKYGGEWSIQDKEENKYLHYLEGNWITPQGWEFWLFYDRMEEETIRWYVMLGNRDDERKTFGKESLEEAKEWIELQHKSKEEYEDWWKGSKH